MLHSNSEIDSEIPEDTLAYARQQGSYFYYDSMELKFRTNVSGMEDYFIARWIIGFQDLADVPL